MLDEYWVRFKAAANIKDDGSVPPEAMRFLQFCVYAGVGVALDILESERATIEQLKEQLHAALQEHALPPDQK